MPTSSTRRSLSLLLAGSLLAACAGNPPLGLEDALPQAPSPRTVQAAQDGHVGEAVRWGGEILGVRNEAGVTEVELYHRPLFDNAEPKPEGGDGVRFIARVAGFLDPAEYKPGKRLTVRGRLDPVVTRPVGDYPYLYPVVAVVAHHLWPVYQPPPEPAWLYDPFYDPWWPWGPWGPWRYRPYW